MSPGDRLPFGQKGARLGDLCAYAFYDTASVGFKVKSCYSIGSMW